MPNEVTVTKFLRSKHKRDNFSNEKYFCGKQQYASKKKQKRKQKKSSEIKSGLDLGSTDLDTKKSPGNAGPTLASNNIKTSHRIPSLEMEQKRQV